MAPATIGADSTAPIPWAEPKRPNKNGDTSKTSSANTTTCWTTGMASAEMNETVTIAVTIPGEANT